MPAPTRIGHNKSANCVAPKSAASDTRGTVRLAANASAKWPMNMKKGDGGSAVACILQFDAPRVARRLLEMLADELRHLEHGHRALAAEHRLQLRVGIDVALVLRIL